MQKRYILSLDQGTTSSRAVLFDSLTGQIAGMKSVPLRQIYPQPGWVEHDPSVIYDDQLEAMTGAIEEAAVSPEQIACIGITNQRETVVVWEKSTGKPVYNAIVWQCRRSSDICDNLKISGLVADIKRKTGLVIDAYFSGTKIKWILDNVEGAREKAEKGELLAGTIDSWLVWKLSGGQTHVTDYSNASRTMLYNIKELQWDEDMLRVLDIPECMLPKVVPSSGICAYTKYRTDGSKTDDSLDYKERVVKNILDAGIPVSGMAGDQHAALFGQACFKPGDAKNTYGTGCFILMNTGKTPVESKNNLLTTIAWGIDNEVEYALEGSVFNAGAAIQWLRDELGIIDSAQQSDMMAEQVEDTGGVYVVPAFTGLGAPYWDMYARGTIIGLTRGTNKMHIARATLEAIAYQSRDVLEAMRKDSSMELNMLKVDGGASVSEFLMQFQSDILNIPVLRPVIRETTALGAAYLAGLGVGIWKSREEIADSWNLDTIFRPSNNKEHFDTLYLKWKNAVERSMKWDL
ncbi:glycerol kinase GlpK [Ruminiclostridium cellobioparum]|jgi:glycerol kinase|uniref:glycerol kinase GlpK n=1 Tax=Ruminiclostridium cellobioparum TaxID=29355 RepID=UPI00048294F7|nr:glycerol kinase GlpK [Ruminiclostridium cellobioparum]